MATKKKPVRQKKRKAPPTGRARVPRRKTARGSGVGTSTNGEVDDGTITIICRSGKFAGQSLEMDVSVVKLVCEELERKHDMKADSNGLIVAKPEFLVDLSRELESLGYSSTPTIALHVWLKSHAYFAELQKKTSP